MKSLNNHRLAVRLNRLLGDLLLFGKKEGPVFRQGLPDATLDCNLRMRDGLPKEDLSPMP